MADTETLDDLVRRVDPDRWLATRFIGDAAARADVIALYGLNYELARVAGGVSNALMGEIRITWWREAMEEIAAGKPPRKHPNVEALAASGFDPDALAVLAEARFADLDEGPLEDEAAVLAYVDATAGALAGRAWPSAISTRLRVMASSCGRYSTHAALGTAAHSDTCNSIRKCGQIDALQASARCATLSHGVMPPMRATSACTTEHPPWRR